MKRVLHACRRRLAIALASISLHRMTRRSADGQMLVVKHRSRLAKLLIPPGNLYLRMMGADSFVLSTAEWHHWETVMSTATIECGNVVTRLHAGKTLDQILRDDSVTADEKQAAVRLALREILALHSREARWSDGEVRPLSHGDATAKNVCVDLKNQSAVWFDFDMIHRKELSAVDRHADDLRALFFSSATCLPQSSLSLLAELCSEKVASPELLHALHRLLNVWRRPSTFQLAQAPLSYAAYHDLRAKLMAAIHGNVGDYRE